MKLRLNLVRSARSGGRWDMNKNFPFVMNNEKYVYGVFSFVKISTKFIWKRQFCRVSKFEAVTHVN